ncbi:hypothetical protein BDR26DRAFT_290772 [Obelidium mucronatum]|nr:hypothetical protein BDR26DRAFT_290772 [Obelidium mucronatum]
MKQFQLSFTDCHFRQMLEAELSIVKDSLVEMKDDLEIRSGVKQPKRLPDWDTLCRNIRRITSHTVTISKNLDVLLAEVTQRNPTLSPKSKQSKASNSKNAYGANFVDDSDDENVEPKAQTILPNAIKVQQEFFASIKSAALSAVANAKLKSDQLAAEARSSEKQPHPTPAMKPPMQSATKGIFSNPPNPTAIAKSSAVSSSVVVETKQPLSKTAFASSAQPIANATIKNSATFGSTEPSIPSPAVALPTNPSASAIGGFGFKSTAPTDQKSTESATTAEPAKTIAPVGGFGFSASFVSESTKPVFSGGFNLKPTENTGNNGGFGSVGKNTDLSEPKITSTEPKEMLPSKISDKPKPDVPSSQSTLAFGVSAPVATLSFSSSKATDGLKPKDSFTGTGALAGTGLSFTTTAASADSDRKTPVSTAANTSIFGSAITPSNSSLSLVQVQLLVP